MGEEGYRLTEAACMQLALSDFNIEVSTKMAGAIEKVFMEYMMNAGHIEKEEFSE